MSQISTVAVPGQLLGSTSKYIPGPGTHVHNSNLYASILGPVTATIPPKPAGPQKRLTKITPAAPAPLPTVSIDRNLSEAGPGKDGTIAKAEILPEVNSTVLCRVTRITPRQASVAILVVGETVLDGEWQGLIRVQDVRATEKDKVKIFESFRPGDIVRAVVISLGDQANYYLSTASNHLGVIMATSEAGNAMYPVSWKEYKDPETGMSENRKVAKPF
ncbi:putative CSL4-core component of the 3`-5` exosome [Coleophoma crateriformis]|uniref:Putative CSL4-core component of the 3`-5` exosome n=1 Tax=Coleophoma crateriformis TaxID=565419 RepID=A0A3D8T8E0_9HELO|nr:putative CSL4-core component of the 3`-5` exosome [Coleophoma crateriformis]